MDGSVRSLRWRRRRYALVARRRRVLRGFGFPRVVGLPGGLVLERRAYLFWRVRLALWVVLVAAGWLAVGWAGVAPGAAAAIVVELIFSYRRPGATGRPVAMPGNGPGLGGPGGSSGVREPRRPHPAGGAGAAQLPAGPAPDGMD